MVAEEPERPPSPEPVKEVFSPPSKPNPPPPKGLPAMLRLGIQCRVFSDTLPDLCVRHLRNPHPYLLIVKIIGITGEGKRAGMSEPMLVAEMEMMKTIPTQTMTNQWSADSPIVTTKLLYRACLAARGRGEVRRRVTVKSKKKEYQVRGVQTISPEMREQAIQVSILVDSPKVSNAPKLSQDQKIGSPRRSSLTLQTGNSRRPQWTTSSVPSALPPIVSVGRGGSPGSRVNPTGAGIGSGGNDASNSHTSPTLDPLSPREYGFKESPTTVQPPARSSSSSTITPFHANVVAMAGVNQRSFGSPQGPNAPPLGPLHNTSNDSMITSPPLSAGPVSPHEGQPITSVASSRKAGRVFDPARGVELFKCGSEEVLARFLKMSSWEEESSPQR